MSTVWLYSLAMVALAIYFVAVCVNVYRMYFYSVDQRRLMELEQEWREQSVEIQRLIDQHWGSDSDTAVDDGGGGEGK